jgi:O-antigen/teichoic acid export membrane protein
MALAVLGASLISLVTTIAFARLLGSSGYGSLGTLISALLILMVPGSAIQVTAAREVSLRAAEGMRAPAAGVRRVLAQLVYATLVLTGLSIVFREQLADLIGVDTEWAAATTVPNACLWLILSIERGVLQGLRRYRLVGWSVVGEAAARLPIGIALVELGLDVTGAFLATALSVLFTALALAAPLRRLPAVARGEAQLALPALLLETRTSLIALSFLGVLRNVDVIVVKHQAAPDVAGGYAAAGVATKAIVWVAIGVGFYLVPEAARGAGGGRDPRPVLARASLVLLAAAAPMLLIYAVAGRWVLGTVFGDDLTQAADALPWLGLAMTLLAWSYLLVQYLLALSRSEFLLLLAAAALLEPLLLVAVGDDLVAIALALVALQAVVCATCLAMSLHARHRTFSRQGGRGP